MMIQESKSYFILLFLPVLLAFALAVTTCKQGNTDRTDDGEASNDVDGASYVGRES